MVDDLVLIYGGLRGGTQLDDMLIGEELDIAENDAKYHFLCSCNYCNIKCTSRWN